MNKRTFFFLRELAIQIRPVILQTERTDLKNCSCRRHPFEFHQNDACHFPDIPSLNNLQKHLSIMAHAFQKLTVLSLPAPQSDRQFSLMIFLTTIRAEFPLFQIYYHNSETKKYHFKLQHMHDKTSTRETFSKHLLRPSNNAGNALNFLQLAP